MSCTLPTQTHRKMLVLFSLQFGQDARVCAKLLSFHTHSRFDLNSGNLALVSASSLANCFDCEAYTFGQDARFCAKLLCLHRHSRFDSSQNSRSYSAARFGHVDPCPTLLPTQCPTTMLKTTSRRLYAAIRRWSQWRYGGVNPPLPYARPVFQQLARP